MITACSYIFMFFAFSACGWFVESVYRTIGEALHKNSKFRIINSGFLYGPICPIYGTGALFFTVFLINTGLNQPGWRGWLQVFFLGLILADIVEYITSFLMEKLFHARWWDYSNKFLNLHGRICFRHSIYWGAAALLFVYCIHPLYAAIVGRIPDSSLVIITGLILILFVFDLVMTVYATVDVRKFIQKYNDFKNGINVATSLLRDSSEGKAEEMRESIEQTLAPLVEQFSDVRASFDRLVAEPGRVSGNKIFRNVGNLYIRIGNYLTETGERLKEYGVSVPEYQKNDEKTEKKSDSETKK